MSVRVSASHIGIYVSMYIGACIGVYIELKSRWRGVHLWSGKEDDVARLDFAHRAILRERTCSSLVSPEMFQNMPHFKEAKFE